MADHFLQSEVSLDIRELSIALLEQLLEQNEYLSLFVQRKDALSTLGIQRVKKCMDQIAKVFLMQYRVFPLANGINFLFVPEQLRVLGSNIVSVFWNVYLCTLIAKSN